MRRPVIQWEPSNDVRRLESDGNSQSCANACEQRGWKGCVGEKKLCVGPSKQNHSSSQLPVSLHHSFDQKQSSFGRENWV